MLTRVGEVPDEDGVELSDFDPGTPGASARREYERRRANREQRTRERHPRIGGLLLALREAPRHEQAWAQGATGEETVARELASRCGASVIVLHDRRVPHRRANIDHIAIAASGVWVIDSKRYKGTIAVHTPLFGPAKLIIAGRDKSKLADGLATQIALVQSVVAETAPEAPVHGALCFVDGDLPLIGTLSVNGCALLSPRRLAKRIDADGPLSRDRATALAQRLAERFPPA